MTNKKSIVEDGKKNRTILVLEDERALLGAIKIKLEHSGFDVVSARSVDQALSYLEDIQQLDAVWLDHYLFGEGDGLSFVEAVKKEGSKWRHIPIFVVSNTASQKKVNAYIHLGVSNYFVKAEHRLDEIISQIDTAIEHNE